MAFKMKHWLRLSFLIFFPACLHTPPPHTRAVEANELCAAYISQGDLTTAEVQCDLALQFAPQFADPFVNKGLIAMKRGQTDNAKELYIKALRYNQEHASAYNNLGYIYLMSKAYGKAHDNFQRALKVNPDYLEARYNLALTFIAMNQPAKAKKELRTVVAINPNVADPYAELGKIAHEEGALQEAEERFRKAVELAPRFADAWLALGNVLAEAGKPCEGKDAYESCVDANSEKIECRRNLAVVNKACGLQDQSLKELKELKEGRKTALDEYAMAKNYKDKGLRNDEKRAYFRCLKFDAKFPPCHYGLFELFKADRDDKQAKTACQNFLKFAEGVEYVKEVETCERYVSASTY
jgi:tetratricopeptide (TPR) repeat protein